MSNFHKSKIIKETSSLSPITLKEIPAKVIEESDGIYLTKIDEEFTADAFFPEINYDEWEIINSEIIEKTEKGIKIKIEKSY